MVRGNSSRVYAKKYYSTLYSILQDRNLRSTVAYARQLYGVFYGLVGKETVKFTYGLFRRFVWRILR